MKSHHNKCVWIQTVEVGEVFASCEKDFWVRIDDGDSLVGKTFSVYIIPYPYGGANNCKWRALYVCPKEEIDLSLRPLQFPVSQPSATPPPLPVVQCAVPVRPQAIPVQIENKHSAESVNHDEARLTEQQIAVLEEDILELELSAINGSQTHSTSDTPPHIETHSECDKPLASNSTTSSQSSYYGPHSTLFDNTNQSLSHSASTPAYLQSNMGHTQSPLFLPNGVGGYGPPQGLARGEVWCDETVIKAQKVDGCCQTVPSKEKELMLRIMNNKDLFTACMKKFPELVFEICKSESLLPSH